MLGVRSPAFQAPSVSANLRRVLSALWASVSMPVALRTPQALTSKMTVPMPATCVLHPHPRPGEPGGGAAPGAWESQMWWLLVLPE